MSFLHSEIAGISLYIKDTDEIIRESVTAITLPDLQRNNIALDGGPSDLRLGTNDYAFDCKTCQNNKERCPGHPGHILLRYPVVQPMFVKVLTKWLRVVCFNCGKLVIDYIPGLPMSERLGEHASSSGNMKNPVCVHCEAVHPHIVKDKNDNVTFWQEEYKDKKRISNKRLFPHEMRRILERVPDDLVKKMGLPLTSHPRKLIIGAIEVPPTTIRPDSKRQDAGRSNDDITTMLQSIIRTNNNLPTEEPAVITDELESQITNLNMQVFEMIRGSSDTSKKRKIETSNRRPINSIAKRWPKKWGRIRRNLMGRRVNYIMRSFITCDVSLAIDEVGIPLYVAQKIQIPEVVRVYNRSELMVYFLNGKQKKYPGCSKIIKASGGEFDVEKLPDAYELQEGDTVLRDMIDGDVCIANRAPSLLWSNLSAMRVKVFKNRDTIALNVCSCPFN